MSARLPSPSPSIGTDLHRHLQGIVNAVNALPNFSVFSFSSPNSNVTASVPTLGFNASSSGSKVWAKTIGSGNTGWQPIA